MTVDTFFEKFEEFADAPGAVERMREVVLGLAVQGKLCHDGSIEWQEGKLESVIELISGQHLLAHEHNTQGIGIPYLTGPSDFGTRSPIPTRWTEHPKVIAEPGDILITVKGSGVGKLNVVVDHTTAISRQLMAVRVTAADSDFVYLVLRRAAEHFQNAKTGIAIPGIGRKDVLNLKTVLPPLAEQKRIVAKVDELMALCDQLEAQQQERDTRADQLACASLARFAEAPTPGNLNFLFHPSYTISPADLRKSILTLAVQGKLVPQDSSDEPAEELLERLQEARRAVKAKDYDLVTSEEEPYNIPGSWKWVRLGNICLSNDSGWSPQCLPEQRTGNEWGVLKVSAVSWGSFNPNENKTLPPGKEPRPACEVKPGDFILSRANTEELVARSVVVDQTPPNLMMSDKIVRFTFSEEIDKNYLNLANSSGPARIHYAINSSGTSSSMKNVGRGVMCALPIPLPPQAEQKRIVAKVDELMALVDQLETQLTESRATAKNLLEALVAELTAAGAPNRVQSTT